MSRESKLGLRLRDTLIIGLHVLKRLEALHKCGIALNSLCLDNLSYSVDKKELLFCDFWNTSSFEPHLNSAQDLIIVHDRSIKDVLDLFYMLSNLLRPDIYAGFLQKIDVKE